MDLTITVADDRVDFITKLLHELNVPVKPAQVKKREFIATALTAAQEQLVEELKHSLHQVELHQQGKIQLRSAYDLLDEL